MKHKNVFFKAGILLLSLSLLPGMVGCGAISSLAATPIPTPTAKPRPTVTPTATPRPIPTPSRIATLVYRDGSERAIEDWVFVYEFGDSLTKPEGTLYSYTPKKKESETLYLQSESEDKEQITIAPSELARIEIYFQEEPCYFSGVEIWTKSGESYLIELHNNCKDTFPKHTNASISDSFLSDKPYVFGKSLYLYGWIWQDEGYRRMQRITLRRGGGIVIGGSSGGISTVGWQDVQRVIFP